MQLCKNNWVSRIKFTPSPGQVKMWLILENLAHFGKFGLFPEFFQFPVGGERKKLIDKIVMFTSLNTPNKQLSTPNIPQSSPSILQSTHKIP